MSFSSTGKPTVLAGLVCNTLNKQKIHISEKDKLKRAKSMDNAQHFSFDVWSHADEIDTTVNQLLESFRADKAFVRFHRRLYAPAMKGILLNVYHSNLCDPDRWVMVSLSNRGYLPRGPYNPQNIRLVGVREIIKWMIAQPGPFLDFGKGFKTETQVRRSRIRATGRLLDRFRDSKVKPEMLEVNKRVEVVRLKDSRGRLVSYRQSRRTKTMRTLLKRLNTQISRSDIRIAGFSLTPFGKHQHRVFNNKDWGAGGRFYGGDWQPCPKKLRSTITINGQVCVELDFASFHIYLAYALGKKQYDGEGYYLNNSNETLPKLWRDVLKKCTNYALNADSNKKAVAKIQQQIAFKKFELEGLDTRHSPKILYRLVRGNHQRIAHLFGSGAGLRLQAIDSKIAARVFDRFINDNIVCLGIHDSFIVPLQHERQLRETMLESYKQETRGFVVPISKAW